MTMKYYHIEFIACIFSSGNAALFTPKSMHIYLAK